MKIVVLKFGGTSVGTIKKIKKIADIIGDYRKKNYKVIVVSSAMSGVTNDLIQKSKDISENFSSSEYDVLVSSGEQVACSLIAGRLIHKGFKSRSWLAWQIPIFTEGFHKNSRINQIGKKKINKYYLTSSKKYLVQHEPAIVDFIYRKIDNNYISSYGIDLKKIPTNFIYPKFFFKYKGTNIKIPKDSKKYLNFIYGKNWKKKTKFYLKSARV